MIVAFTGGDGAGKSTQIRRVFEHMVAAGTPCTIVDKWDILDTSAYPECRFVRSDREEVRVCIAEMKGIGRCFFLFWMIALTTIRALRDKPGELLLLDGYWMKHAATEVLFGCNPGWMDATVAQFPVADVTVFFDTEPAEALRRKGSGTPYECGLDASCDSQSFLNHQDKVVAKLREWAKEKGWVVVRQDLSEDEGTRFIVSEIRRRASESRKEHDNVLSLPL